MYRSLDLSNQGAADDESLTQGIDRLTAKYCCMHRVGMKGIMVTTSAVCSSLVIG